LLQVYLICQNFQSTKIDLIYNKQLLKKNTLRFHIKIFCISYLHERSLYFILQMCHFLKNC